MLLSDVQYYYELQPDAFIKQPWNAYSSLFFFVPVVYWLWKLKGAYQQQTILLAILPLLFLNGIGSTLFHAFNGGTVFMLLDVVPPLLMVIFLAAYFWKIAINSWRLGLLITAGFVGLNALINYWIRIYGGSDHDINVYYFVSGIMILTPILWTLIKTHWVGWIYIAMTLGAITLALFFRGLDYPTPNPFPDLMPQGTHFLWHISSALSVFPLGRYLVLISANPDVVTARRRLFRFARIRRTARGER